MSAGGASAAAPTPTAAWIGRDTPGQAPQRGEQNPAPLLRRAFSLPPKKRVARARLEIVGLGLYQAWINGRHVGDYALDTGPSQYDKIAYSRSYDVTRLLHRGRNAIGVMLGRGYFSSPADGGFGLPDAPWRQEPRLRAVLDVTLRGGARRRIVTDNSWKIADGPLRDSFYTGEDYDARREIPGWTSAAFDDSSWQAAPEQPSPTERVVPAGFPPVRITRTWQPVRMTEPQAGTKVYDFGRITAGWARIHVTGDPGTVVTLKYGEQLDSDGHVAFVNIPGLGDVAKHLDTYTLRGDPKGEVWEPSFTRHGFQYVEVTVSGGRLSNFAIEARENNTDLERTGTFTTSNRLLQTIHDNQVATVSHNLWGFPTDTPWRDRQGWTADAWLFMDSAVMNFDTEKLYDRWLLSYRAAQQSDGSLPEIVPDPSPTPGQTDNDPSWGGTYIFDVWRQYELYGKREMLTTHYTAMRKWVDLMEGKLSPAGLYIGFSFGDWASPGSEDGNNVLLAPKAGPVLTANADLYQEVRTLSRIAQELGYAADAKRYSDLADSIRTAFNRAFFDSVTNTYRTPTFPATGYQQTSNVIALAYGMAPKDNEQAVVANLVNDVKSSGTKLDTGAIGTKYVLPVLTEHGYGQLAYDLATQTAYPSWGYWVTQGANSSWETWKVAGTWQSKDHAFLGTVEDWLYQHLAGIQPAAAGYREIRIAPIFPTGLDDASASQDTPAGRVSSGWRRGDGGVTLEVVAPRGASTTVTLPVPSGRVQSADGQVTGSDASSVTYLVTPGRHVFLVS